MSEDAAPSEGSGNEGELSETALLTAPGISVANRFLIPEILDCVFRLLRAPEQARVALVCRSWSELALDNLWRYRLTSAIPLLKILVPLRLDEERHSWVREQKGYRLGTPHLITSSRPSKLNLTAPSTHIGKDLLPTLPASVD